MSGAHPVAPEEPVQLLAGAPVLVLQQGALFQGVLPVGLRAVAAVEALLPQRLEPHGSQRGRGLPACLSCLSGALAFLPKTPDSSPTSFCRGPGISPALSLSAAPSDGTV